MRAQISSVPLRPGFAGGEISAISRAVVQGVYDGTIGIAKGIPNAPTDAWNGVTGTLLNSGGWQWVFGGSNPLAIPLPMEYTNATQSRYGSASGAGFLFGTGLGGGAVISARSATLSFVPEVAAVSSRSAASTDFVQTGSYLHRFESGKFYAGKGSPARMKQTGDFFSRTYDDPIVSSDFFPATSNRSAFMNEHILMMENGGPLKFDPLSPTYNKIFSPGRKFF